MALTWQEGVASSALVIVTTLIVWRVVFGQVDPRIPRHPLQNLVIRLYRLIHWFRACVRGLDSGVRAYLAACREEVPMPECAQPFHDLSGPRVIHQGRKEA